MSWLQEHLVLLAGLAMWATGVAWLMPGSREPRRPWLPGLLLTAAGVLLSCSAVGSSQPDLAAEFLFWLCGGGALLSGVLMICDRDPVYSALWFALVTLGTCGLFVLGSAPFLAAATVIVYAGAVIVTFLFVIMLARQSGPAAYDRRSRQPVMVVVTSFALLAAITTALPTTWPAAAVTEGVAATDGAAVTDGAGLNDPTVAARANSLSVPTPAYPLGSMQGLGRSLFGDYLFAVELAGTLLLVACVGAITIAPRREQGAI